VGESAAAVSAATGSASAHAITAVTVHPALVRAATENAVIRARSVATAIAQKRPLRTTECVRSAIRLLFLPVFGDSCEPLQEQFGQPADLRKADKPAPNDYLISSMFPLEMSVYGRTRSLLFLLAPGVASLFLAAEILLAGVASSFHTASQGRRIAAIDRDDPRLEYRLGRMCSDIDPAAGVAHLRRAVELSPHSRRYWSHLASACESKGDTQCTEQAWELLANLCPMVPIYRLHAAESYLLRNQVHESVIEFRRLLDMDPTYGPIIWFDLSQILKPDDLFQKMLAGEPDNDVKVSYVYFLSTQGEKEAAYRIWKLIVTSPRPFKFSSAKPYLERLIDLDRIEEAESVWQELQRLRIVREPEPGETGALVFNGDFEHTPLDAGFDWRVGERMTYLALDFAAPDAFHGTRCLRVDFTVDRNDEYEPVYELVPVLPNHTYQLQAEARSEDITSTSGPRLRVRDPLQASFEDVQTEPTVGTTPWHALHLSFSTGPDTHVVRLSLWRPRGRMFPTEISGSFWLDAVSLSDAGPVLAEVGAPDASR
jgi:tetratricopeptide (TPR) repeat protein